LFLNKKQYFYFLKNLCDQSTTMTSLPINQNDSYFRLLAENSIVGVIVLSNKCEILFANDFFCSLLGYSNDELLAQNISLITHPDDRKQCNSEFESVFSNQKDGFQVEKRYLTKNGDSVWCEMSISANRTIDGNIDILTGIINDISSRKKIEIKNDENQQLFSSIFKNSPVAIILGSVETQQYLDVNDAFTNIMGYTRDEIIGQKSSELSMFENDADRIQMIKKVRGKGFISGYQVNCKTKSGKILTVLFSIATVKVNNIDCLILTAMDISERIAIESALKESEQNYRKLVDFLPDGIAVHQNGKIVFANGIAIKMLEGTSEFDFIGMSALDIVHPDYRNIVVERIEKTSQSEEGTILIEEIFLSKKGNLINVEVASLPFRFAGNNATLVVFREISARKNTEFELIKAKNKAEESDRLKSAFLANMSHEIRTPMNAIKGFAQLLEDPDLTQEKRRQFITIINQRTDDLLMLINDILDTAKIEAGQMSISETIEDISNLFNDIFQFFNTQQELNHDQSVELKFINELKSDQYVFSADFFRLRQIFINLINNSIKFTNKGHIYFGCRLIENNTLLFFVEDTGIGIPDEKKDLVFAPFRQLNDNHISRQQSGTGLGLSIVKGLIKLMNGKVWFESEIGNGTTFFFTIPYLQTHNHSVIKNQKQTEVYDWKMKTILLVEDDEYNAKLVLEYLHKTKVKILVAKNGLEAIKLFKQNQDINITLMDIQLPDINGFELTHMFKAMKPNCLIIAQTAYAAEMDKKRALSSGCVDYISKPIKQQNLLQLIQKYFAN